MFAHFTDRSWMWLAAGFYLAGFALGTLSLLRGGRPSGAVNCAAIVAGYLLQNLGLYLRGRAVGGCPLGNNFEIYQFTAWSAITLYLGVGVTFR
jgi:HemX protein